MNPVITGRENNEIIVKDKMENDTRFNVVSNNKVTNPWAGSLKRIHYNR